MRPSSILLALLPCALAFSTPMRLPNSLSRHVTGPDGMSASPLLSPIAPVAAQPRATDISLRLGGGGCGGGGGFDPRSLVGPVIFVSLVASGALGWIFNGILFLSIIPLCTSTEPPPLTCHVSFCTHHLNAPFGSLCRQSLGRSFHGTFPTTWSRARVLTAARQRRCSKASAGIACTAVRPMAVSCKMASSCAMAAVRPHGMAWLRWKCSQTTTTRRIGRLCALSDPNAATPALRERL